MFTVTNNRITIFTIISYVDVDCTASITLIHTFDIDGIGAVKARESHHVRRYIVDHYRRSNLTYLAHVFERGNRHGHELAVQHLISVDPRYASGLIVDRDTKL